MRVALPIFLLFFFTFFSCKKEAVSIEYGTVRGHILTPKNNTPIEGVTISVFGIEKHKQWRWDFLEEPFLYSYYVESTVMLATAKSNENGFYELNYDRENYIKYILRFDRSTALSFPLQECTSIFTDDINQFGELTEGTMEVNYNGKINKDIYVDLKDVSCTDNSVLKYFIIGHFEENGEKNPGIIFQGDRTCDSILMHSGIQIPGYVEWEYELNGQQYYHIDSVMDIDNCTSDTIRAYY